MSEETKEETEMGEIKCNTNKNPKSMLGKLTDFLIADSDMTPEQVRADLEAAGVDVDAFVTRVNETVERCNRCLVKGRDEKD